MQEEEDTGGSSGASKKRFGVLRRGAEEVVPCRSQAEIGETQAGEAVGGVLRAGGWDAAVPTRSEPLHGCCMLLLPSSGRPTRPRFGVFGEEKSQSSVGGCCGAGTALTPPRRPQNPAPWQCSVLGAPQQGWQRGANGVTRLGCFWGGCH